MAAGHDDIAAMTSTLRNIRLGFAQGAAATRVQRAMRAFLLRKGTIFITPLITKIQAAARGLNTRTSLTKFFKACPPSGRTADLFLSRVYGGHEGGRRRGGGYVVDFIYCLRSTRLPLSRSRMRWPDSLSKSTTPMTQCAAATEPSGSALRSPESSCACLRPRPPSPPVSRPAPVIQSTTSGEPASHLMTP